MTPTQQAADRVVLNGIDGATGRYLVEPMQKADLARMVRAERDKAVLADIANRQQARKDHHGPIPSVNPQKLEEAGWGVVFPAALDSRRLDALKQQLQPLLDLRREQAGALYREFSVDTGVQPGQTKFDWTKGATGLVDPKHIPYYLLLVADPEEIPYQFQFQLDIQYAVGRIHFDDLEDYGKYARCVAAAESGKIARPKRAAYFGVMQEDDMATHMSWNFLTKPLTEWMPAAWSTQVVPPGEARKARLAGLMGGPETPAFLFTASHGLGYQPDDPRQYSHGGALMCGDYPGPDRGVTFGPDCYFAGADVSENAEMAGLVAFFFACYGAGTPQINSFPMKDNEKVARRIAPSAFVANLPKRMLAQGALAVVSHVDRAWTYSYFSPRTGGQNTTFRSALDLLLNQGSRLGFAMEPFNSRYAEMSSLLVENSDLDPDVPEAADLLAFYWTSHNDARNYAVVGDPAVRVCAVEGLTKAKIDLAQQQPEPVTVAQEIAQAGHDSFSWGEAKEAVSDAVAELRDKLGDMLDRTLTGLTTLQVVSRTSDDSRRAETKVDLTGRTESVIPLKDGAIDETLWKLHQEMVDKAMAHRAAMWQVAANVAGQAVGWLGKK